MVLTGAGGKAFVSGADISKFESERATLEATKNLQRHGREGLCRHPRLPQADHRHDPRLLHRRRAGARGLLRPAHLLRQFALRGAGGQARARLLLCRAASGSSTSSDQRSPRRSSSPRASSTPRRPRPWASSTASCRRPSSKTYVKNYRRDDRRQRAAHGQGGQVHRRRGREGRDRKRNLARCAEMVEQCFASNDYIEGRTRLHGEAQAGIYRYLTAGADG